MGPHLVKLDGGDVGLSLVRLNIDMGFGFARLVANQAAHSRSAELTGSSTLYQHVRLANGCSKYSGGSRKGNEESQIREHVEGA